MEKMSGFLLLLLSVLNFAVSVETTTVEATHFPNGGKLTLELRPPPPDRITNIVWKFKDDLLAEWVESKVPLKYYSPFENRATLNLITGRLVIDSMTRNDMGLYSAEINNKFHEVSYEAILVKDVDRPTVWISPLKCGPGSGNCTKKCEVSTAETGPVTYSWDDGQGNWRESAKEVTFDETQTKHVKTFSCRVNNRFSEKGSEPKPNPFYTEPQSVVGIVIGVIFVGLIIIAVVVVTLWKKGIFKNGGNSAATAANGASRPPPTTSSDEPDMNPDEIPLKTESA